MTRLVQPRLVNEPFSDPGLLIDFRFERRALLFDLGDLTPLSTRELLRVSHVFVSHRHMDHFAGFDRMLRLRLYRPGLLDLAGPPGFIDGVAAKLAAYSWNLLDETSADFSIRAADYADEGCVRRSLFRARDGFRQREVAPPALPAGLVLEEGAFRIEAATLDHGTPCLAFAFQETMRVNVWRQGLEALGLPVGPWLGAAKEAVRRGAPDDCAVTVAPGIVIPLGVLKERAIRTAPGERIAYVVDAAFHAENVRRITALAQGADQLFIEAHFLEEDAALAREWRHLTARQAGRIARKAGVKRVTPLHFSPRYLEREADLRREVEAAFSTDAPVEPGWAAR